MVRELNTTEEVEQATVRMPADVLRHALGAHGHMSSLSNDSRDDPCRQPSCTRHDGFWTLQNLFGTPSCGFRVHIAIL